MRPTVSQSEGAIWVHHRAHRLSSIPYIPDLAIAPNCILANLLRGRIPDDDAVVDQILERLAETDPLFLVHVNERTNDALDAKIKKYALERGYRKVPTGRLTLMIRPQRAVEDPR